MLNVAKVRSIQTIGTGCCSEGRVAALCRAGCPRHSADCRATRGGDGGCAFDAAFPHLTEAVAARCEVVLCAGALHSPAILQRSGVGDFTALAAAGVKHRVLHLPAVGENLQDHLQIRAVYRLADGVDTAAIAYTVKDALRYTVVFPTKVYTESVYKLKEKLKTLLNRYWAKVRLTSRWESIPEYRAKLSRG